MLSLRIKQPTKHTFERDHFLNHHRNQQVIKLKLEHYQEVIDVTNQLLPFLRQLLHNIQTKNYNHHHVEIDTRLNVTLNTFWVLSLIQYSRSFSLLLPSLLSWNWAWCKLESKPFLVKEDYEIKYFLDYVYPDINFVTRNYSHYALSQLYLPFTEWLPKTAVLVPFWLKMLKLNWCSWRGSFRHSSTDYKEGMNK